MEGESINLYAELFKTAGMLAIVLGVMIGLLYLFKKYTTFAAGGLNKSSIKHLSSFHMGNREKLVIVEVEERRLLLGVTQNNISLILELDKIENENVETEKVPDFADILKKNIIKGGLFSRKGKKAEDE
jgi:flagellar protein FliO/FliZ